jgi:hypothetical protein
MCIGKKVRRRFSNYYTAILPDDVIIITTISIHIVYYYYTVLGFRTIRRVPRDLQLLQLAIEYGECVRDYRLYDDVYMTQCAMFSQSNDGRTLSTEMFSCRSRWGINDDVYYTRVAILCGRHRGEISLPSALGDRAGDQQLYITMLYRDIIPPVRGGRPGHCFFLFPFALLNLI